MRLQRLRGAVEDPGELNHGKREGAPARVDTQIRFTTDDAAEAHAELTARGVDVDAEILRYPVPMFAFRDEDGNRLVIVEQPKG